MRFLSVCSGIEAASVAWEPLGWRAAAFSEIAPFPSAVLAHRFGSNLPGEALSANGIPNLGDMTKFQGWPDYAIDILVGGTPCQSFSVAGLRAGLADPRGNLTLVYLAILDRYRPRWCVWENVPGVLSSGDGRDFGAILVALGQLGYGWAYQILDAQYVRVDGFGRAVPQRRRRVFVVGHIGGDPRRAAAVLFDAASLRGDSAPRREARQSAASAIGGGPDESGGAGVIAASGASTLNAAFGSKLGLENQHIDQGSPLFVAHTLRGHGFDASEDGTGRGTPLVAVAFDLRGRDGGATFEGPHDTANIRAASGGSSRSYVATDWAVRRLTPTECERLQAFPDGWTDVPYRGKQAADGPRYQALGNSMAVNVMRWIGRRIEMVEAVRAGLTR